MRRAKTLTLEGVAKNIACPIYLVGGELDKLTPLYSRVHRGRGVGALRAADRQGRQPRCQQPALHVPDAGRGLDGGYPPRPSVADVFRAAAFGAVAG